RGELAARIGDEETVRVAEEWTVRHTERVAVLEQKVSAQEAELERRTREAEEMKRRYHEADANRMLLLAELKRGAARERVHGIGERLGRSEDDWARMEEKIHSTQGYADALEELEEEPGPPPGGGAAEVEDRLRELKRRMGRE
ncbi:MAG TPA: hypothetical protein VFI96_05110, partial [Longimicrobiaceae bacterium]|nr:hypothetical protein [Longimicrobiaceae bacterium]